MSASFICTTAWIAREKTPDWAAAEVRAAAVLTMPEPESAVYDRAEVVDMLAAFHRWWDDGGSDEGAVLTIGRELTFVTATLSTGDDTEEGTTIRTLDEYGVLTAAGFYDHAPWPVAT